MQCTYLSDLYKFIILKNLRSTRPTNKDIERCMPIICSWTHLFIYSFIYNIFGAFNQNLISSYHETCTFKLMNGIYRSHGSMYISGKQFVYDGRDQRINNMGGTFSLKTTTLKLKSISKKKMSIMRCKNGSKHLWLSL